MVPTNQSVIQIFMFICKNRKTDFANGIEETVGFAMGSFTSAVKCTGAAEFCADGKRYKYVATLVMSCEKIAA